MITLRPSKCWMTMISACWHYDHMAYPLSCSTTTLNAGSLHFYPLSVFYVSFIYHLVYIYVYLVFFNCPSRHRGYPIEDVAAKRPCQLPGWPRTILCGSLAPPHLEPLPNSATPAVFFCYECQMTNCQIKLVFLSLRRKRALPPCIRWNFVFWMIWCFYLAI